MDIVSTFAGPRLCFLGGRAYFVRPISIDGMCMLLAWLDDMIPGRDERQFPPAFNAPESREQLNTPAGQALLAWLAVREHGMSFSEVAAITIEPGEINRIWNVLMARRRTIHPDEMRSDCDIADTWCGEGMAAMATAYGLRQLGEMSIDQLEWLSADGKLDAHLSPDSLGFARAMEHYNEAVARQKEREEQKEGAA